MRHIGVATYAPMKRGLKVGQDICLANALSSSNLCPDEKGTERLEKFTATKIIS